MPSSPVHRRPFALTALTGLLIAALAACGSAPAPTPTRTATPTAAPTATPTATTPTAASWNYRRNFVVKAFTDKEHLTFGKAVKTGPYTSVTSEFTAGNIVVDITGNTGGAAAVTDVLVQDESSAKPVSKAAVVVGKEMIFALRLMEPNAANEAIVWVQSEYDKARADKKTPIKDTKIFGSVRLDFEAQTFQKQEQMIFLHISQAH